MKRGGVLAREEGMKSSATLFFIESCEISLTKKLG